ncbi:hypothetical protein ACFQ1S_29890 [Kibdelosporangium lantanae]|uniref:DUF7402 domain-containing protein n=1 Tax=Kibdelosporangium lantanae TaxID=1497396 RepID=A0ABW3MHA0_9PSEU
MSGMDNSGTGRVVRFTPRTVTWTRFEITSTATNRNAGLSEIEVYRT